MSKAFVDVQPPKADDAGESDAERLAVLKQINNLAKKQQEKVESQTKAKQRALIEEYKERAEKKVEADREERRRRLEKLRSRSVSSTVASQELSEDDEYAELMRMYGNRIRLHLPQLPPLESSMMSHSESANSLVAKLKKKPRVPRTRRGKPGQDALSTFRKTIIDVVRTQQDDDEEGVSKSKRNKSVALRASVAAPKVMQLPPLKESKRSMMPKKEILRRRQQEMLKKSDVVFYKDQMKAHMNRILAAVELSFDNDTMHDWKDKCSNLAKPRATAKRNPAEMTPVVPAV